MKHKIKYVEPSVKLCTNTDDKFGFFVWLKSRQWIIEDLVGNKFAVNLTSDEGWFDKLPSKFKVGNELVEKGDYFDRINKMNLQYNNLGCYNLEIQGSALFRDILFNVNKIGEWAMSNRFLFSILDKDEVYNPANYIVSSEYKGIKSWESQFNKYMDAIKVDKIVDNNRLEMPYSISSLFWLSMNKKTAYDVLSFLKYKAPFFYDIYGAMIIKECGLSEECIPTEPSAGILQYIRDESLEFVEDEVVEPKNGIINMNTKMGLILYSQFLRQSDTIISGLYNELIHSNASEFKDKVFKGGTILDVNYVASKVKASVTAKTRMCAFAMSSGDGPCSWSYFLNKFLPKGDLTPTEFMEYLPCKFVNKRFVGCKYYDDVKFRNEGLEVSNCPCPIMIKSEEKALDKQKRDKNRIGDGFHQVTKYLLGKRTYEFKVPSIMAWTSDLNVASDNRIEPKTSEFIISLLEELEVRYKNYNGTKDVLKIFDSELYLSNPEVIFPDMDCTSAMKGHFIDLLVKHMREEGHTSYTINFGGDIFVENSPINVKLGDTKFDLELNGTYSIFTSGNNSKRGNHIPKGLPMSTVTQVVEWNGDEVDNLLVDVMTTKYMAREYGVYYTIESLLGEFGKAYSPIHIDLQSNTIVNKVYCAAPFFNTKQIKIRNKMVKNFCNVIRPDLLPNSVDYNNGDISKTKEVVDDNLSSISSPWTSFLVYPLRTNDLGTLYEVGYAMASDKVLIKYDESKDSYSFVYPKSENSLSINQNYLFDCTDKANIVSMGYASKFMPGDRIFYELKGKNDNIMLSEQFTHVELNKSGNYDKIKRDKADKDR